MRLVIAAMTTALAFPAFAEEIQPISGLWRGTVDGQHAEGCPPGVAEQVAIYAAGYEHEIVFPVPFGPDSLSDDADFTWEHLAENTWKGVFTETTVSPMGDVNVTAISDLLVVSEDHIRQDSSFTTELPEKLIEVLGGTTKCTITALVNHHLVSAK